MMNSSLDSRTGIIVSTSSGARDPQEAEVYRLEMMDLIARSRAATGRALHLVDATAAHVQSADSCRPLANATSRATVKFDKVAVVVSSALIRMQAQRVYGDIDMRLFSNRAEAVAWLLAA